MFCRINNLNEPGRQTKCNESASSDLTRSLHLKVEKKTCQQPSVTLRALSALNLDFKLFICICQQQQQQKNWLKVMFVFVSAVDPYHSSMVHKLNAI